MNQQTLSMLLLLTERLIDWQIKLSADHTISFYEVYSDIQHVMNTANDVLAHESINILCRNIQEENLNIQ